jgi:subtilisin family serine protease
MRYKINFQNNKYVDNPKIGEYITKDINNQKYIKLLVKSKSGLSNRFKELINKFRATEPVKIDGLNETYEIWIPFSDVKNVHKICKDIHQSGVVEYCVPQKSYELLSIIQETTDTLYDKQWIFKNTGQYNGISGQDIKLEEAYQYLKRKNINFDKSIMVAVLDDGVALKHEDLPQFNEKFDFVDNDDKPLPGDDNTHGTNVVGIICAIIDNGKGICGINNNLKIIIGRIGSDKFDEGRVAKGIIKAVDMGARIINFSWGVQEVRPIIVDAINYAVSKDVLIVASSGNYFKSNETKQVLFPANMEQVLAVGACDQKGRWVNLANCAVEDGVKKFGSRYGREVDIVAPGVSIVTTKYKILRSSGEEVYSLFDGTSAAAPIVTGIASLLLSINPQLTSTQLRTILLSTADDLRPNHNEGDEITFDHMGHGRINALEAVKKVC